MKLKEGIRVPKGSSFFISSSGFLGDAFVSINPPENPDVTNVYEDGAYVKGTRLEGFGDFAAKGGDVMKS